MQAVNMQQDVEVALHCLVCFNTEISIFWLASMQTCVKHTCSVIVVYIEQETIRTFSIMLVYA